MNCNNCSVTTAMLTSDVDAVPDIKRKSLGLRTMLCSTVQLLHRHTTICVGALILAATLIPTAVNAQSFAPTGCYNLVCRTSGKTLDNGGSQAAGANMTQWALGSAGNTNQEWQITPAQYAPGYYNLICRTSGMALDNRGLYNAGGVVGQWPLQIGNPNQEWQIVSAPNAPGYYNLICRTSGMALDNRGSLSNGSQVGQWPLLNNTNQQWRIQAQFAWVEVDFYTGGDDVRAGSMVNVSVTIDGYTQTFNNVNGGANWKNDTTNIVYLPLSYPVTTFSSGSITITLQQAPGTSSWNADNWDLAELGFNLWQNDPAANNGSYANSGWNPIDLLPSYGNLYRFTMSNPSATFGL